MSTSPSKKTVNAARLALGLGPVRATVTPQEEKPTVATARESLFLATREQRPAAKKLGVVQLNSKTGELEDFELYRVPHSSRS
jgi:hypothetical protein